MRFMTRFRAADMIRICVNFTKFKLPNPHLLSVKGCVLKPN